MPGHRLHQLAATLRAALWPGPGAPGRPASLHWPDRLPGLHWPHRPPGLHWPRERPAPRWPFAWVDVAWVAFSIANLVAIVVFSHWETVPFHFIWISLTLLYGFRVWSIRPTAWVLAVVMVTTFAAFSSSTLWAPWKTSQLMAANVVTMTTASTHAVGLVDQTRNP